MNPPTRQQARGKIGSPVLFHEEKARTHKRRFLVPIYVEIAIEERLLTDVLTDEWRHNFYPLAAAPEVASHLAYNLIQGRRLQSLDGFADQPEEAARILDIDMDETLVSELPLHELADSSLQVMETPRGRKYNWKCTCGMSGVEWRAVPRQTRSDYKHHLKVATKADALPTGPKP